MGSLSGVADCRAISAGCVLFAIRWPHHLADARQVAGDLSGLQKAGRFPALMSRRGPGCVVSHLFSGGIIISGAEGR